MGILQNILKAINTAIDNIDFSPYQLISAKNEANGYLGANANSLLDADKVDYSTMERIFDDFLAQDVIFSLNHYNQIWAKTASTASNIVQETVSQADSGFSDKSKNVMKIKLTDSTNNVSTLSTYIAKHISNTSIIECEVFLSTLSNNGKIWVGFGSNRPNVYTHTNTTIAQAIYIKFDSAENASWTTNVCISNSNTQVDSTIDKAIKTPYKLKIKVDKNTNNIYFYINDSLIDTRTVSSSFLQPTSANDSPFIYFFVSNTGDNTTTNRQIFLDYVDLKDKKVSR